MMRLVIATTNKGKIREIEKVLSNLAITVESLDAQTIPPVVEDGETFTENACKKARHYALHTGCIALADDSGLEVDALQGQPGVHSARYAGKKTCDEENNKKLLNDLQAVPLERRTARFRCVLALAKPDGQCAAVEGICPGRIGLSPRGNEGFGYDPLFVLPDGRTMAELSLEEKNRLSHRGQALRQLPDLLRQFMEG